MKFKRITVLCTSIVIGMALTFAMCISFAGVQEASAMNQTDGGSAYINPKDIVISQPGETHSTTAGKVSILGACDYRYPLYMNGKQITTTEHGFFSVYVELKSGNNAFKFTNNGKTKTVNITRNNTSGGGSNTSTNTNYWAKSHAPKYAVVKGQNASRMSTPGGDGKSMMIPFAKDTMAQIIGEAGNLYCLSDYSFVYKSGVIVKDGILGKNAITKLEFVEDNGLNCTELQLSMNQNAVYNLEKNGDSAILTIYNTSQAAWGQIPTNDVIKSVEVLENGSKGYVTYSIIFQSNAPISGQYVEFSQGKMHVGFKKAPTLVGDGLAGVRIHIDAGHGGTDTGAKGPLATFGPMEKDINLGIALAAKEYLESKGATVIMTRTDDTTTDLATRAAKVAQLKPDLSLSIHCNSMAVTADYNKIQGFLTFYSYDSLGAADYINSYITNKMGIAKSALRYSNLAMTRMTGYPAVLFETSFMSNPTDYELLIKTEAQKSFGVAAGEAVEGFIKSIGKTATYGNEISSEAAK